MRSSAVVLVIYPFFFAMASSTTNQEDVYALNVLFAAMSSPALRGWTATGGDPCSDTWEGVICVGPNITELNLSGLDLMGGLGYSLDKLTALMVLDLSNNQLKGELPFQLPPNAQQVLLANNQLVGGLPYSVTYLSRLTILNVSNNHLYESIPDVFHQLFTLTHMDLSNNSLTGSLPPSFSALKNLNTLLLQNNHFDGTIDVLANLPLKDLDVSNNNFSGIIPPELSSIRSFGYIGNHFNITAGAFPLPFSPPPSAFHFTMPNDSSQGVTADVIERKHNLTQGHIAGIVTACVLTLILAVVVIFFFTWKIRESATENKYDGSTPDSKGSEDASTKSKHKPVPDIAPIKCLMPIKDKIVDGNKDMKGSIAAAIFMIGELQAATSNFNQENLIGEGSSARVYKAKMANGKTLAIKKLDSSIQMVHEKDFLDVLTGISRLRHANITELVGYCIENGHRILVYEYVGNGTLHEALHSGEEKSKQISWNLRIKIALGAARALEYLHEICQPMIVHRNFKSSNILLDKDFSPHLSDCGLLPLMSFGSQCQFSAQHMGSFGYSAPEFAMSGMFSAKTDVYSFGVVMLELLTGRKPLDSSRSRTEQSLVRWATPQLNDIDALSKMVDPALKGMYPAKSLSRFADIIALCVQPEPEFRPPMSEVVQSLVRLLQRAGVHKRRSGDDLGFSQRVSERQELGEG